MDISFVAGFGPISRPDTSSLPFWSQTFGISFEEAAPGYFHTEHVDGVKAFAIWPLEQAAAATFGDPTWPDHLPVPQAWVEFDVASAAAVADAAAELTAAGHVLLKEAGDEPWGQTTCRLQSPEGLLVGVSFTPWMH